MHLYIVTGAAKGLGQALTQEALQQGHHVIAIARSEISKQQNLEVILQNLQDLAALPRMIEALFQTCNLQNYQAIHWINNAGIVEPVGYSQTLNPHDIQKNIDTNLTAPMILANLFLLQTQDFPGLRTVTNVSSGVAENAKATWSTYSAAKAGLRIYSHALAEEQKQNPKTKIISFNPGVMDTQMQEAIRSHSVKDFPDVEKFKAYKREGKLLGPDRVAKSFLRYLKNAEKINKVDVSISEII